MTNALKCEFQSPCWVIRLINSVQVYFCKSHLLRVLIPLRGNKAYKLLVIAGFSGVGKEFQSPLGDLAYGNIVMIHRKVKRHPMCFSPR